MVLGKVASGKDIEESERVFLLTAYMFIGQAKSALKDGQGADFGVAQGALRAVYNGLGEIIYSGSSECLTEARKRELENLSESVFQIRETLVSGTQVDRRDLRFVVNENRISERLDGAMADLKEYLMDWYGCEVPDLD